MTVEADVLSAQRTRWNELESQLQSIYWQPDIEGLHIIYSAVSAHNLPDTEPIWPMVIAPPSSGKTAIALSPLLVLPNTHLLGDLTPKTFLSGKRGKQSSYLHRIGPSGILIMKDYGTILSKRDADRNEIHGQMREVYDGEFGRQGGDVNVQPWKGKITIIAAATQAIDRVWSFQHDLGERFTNVRWRAALSREAGRFACRQIDNERAQRDETRRLLRAFMEGRPLIMPPKLSAEQEDYLVDLATFVSRCRATVVRDSSGKREIIEVGDPEGITRLHKSMSLLTRFHALLFNSPNSVGEADLDIARRVAVDAVRPARWRFLSHVPINGEINRGDLAACSGIPVGSISWIGDELAALGLVNSFSEAEAGYELSTVFRSILQASKLTF